jgi:2-polyprenyl-6-methoxyphenol hydroxylase-like FAD-dependent oxidoreductase
MHRLPVKHRRARDRVGFSDNGGIVPAREGDQVVQTQCAIAGGGPAGMMLGFLLARAGVDVIVLEKHSDFLRDFRGDTIHPSTLEVMFELGLLDQFLQRPHSEVREVGGRIGDETIMLADFTHLPTRCKFLAFMPQWDFLDFLAEQGRRYGTFHLMMDAEVVDVIHREGRIAGLTARTPRGPVEIHSLLAVGADGRQSIVREKAELEVERLGAPMDVLWFRLSKRASDPGMILGRIASGRLMVMLDRTTYWQCGFVIRKGGLDDLIRAGLEAFRRSVVEVEPFLVDRVHELTDWDQVKLLTVAVDRLRQWHSPGLLCIGDAAHAMSPIGGVGINLAIQDAVATANFLAGPLTRGVVSSQDLARVQQRRAFPARVTQAVQVMAQNQVIARVLDRSILSVPWPIRWLTKSRTFRRVAARAVGIGVRPEHVTTREVTLVTTPR